MDDIIKTTQQKQDAKNEEYLKTMGLNSELPAFLETDLPDLDSEDPDAMTFTIQTAPKKVRVPGVKDDKPKKKVPVGRRVRRAKPVRKYAMPVKNYAIPNHLPPPPKMNYIQPIQFGTIAPPPVIPQTIAPVPIATIGAPVQIPGPTGPPGPMGPPGQLGLMIGGGYKKASYKKAKVGKYAIAGKLKKPLPKPAKVMPIKMISKSVPKTKGQFISSDDDDDDDDDSGSEMSKQT